MEARHSAESMEQQNFEPSFAICDTALGQDIQQSLLYQSEKASENLDWLLANMHPYFFITMKEEAEALINLAARLHKVAEERKITLIDQEKKLIVARLDVPGSLYDTLKTIKEREISYAEISHSYHLRSVR